MHIFKIFTIFTRRVVPKTGQSKLVERDRGGGAGTPEIRAGGGRKTGGDGANAGVI